MWEYQNGFSKKAHQRCTQGECKRGLWNRPYHPQVVWKILKTTLVCILVHFHNSFHIFSNFQNHNIVIVYGFHLLLHLQDCLIVFCSMPLGPPTRLDSTALSRCFWEQQRTSVISHQPLFHRCQCRPELVRLDKHAPILIKQSKLNPIN